MCSNIDPVFSKANKQTLPWDHTLRGVLKVVNGGEFYKIPRKALAMKFKLLNY